MVEELCYAQIRVFEAEDEQIDTVADESEDGNGDEEEEEEEEDEDSEEEEEAGWQN